ncbi:MAG: metallopeptidase family protein [Patulibacter sp.]|nr:metallopeptidase family protein [Patulibacter sp.]
MESRGRAFAKLLAVVALLVAVALVSSSMSSLIAGLAIGAAGILLIGSIVAALGVHGAGWDPVSEEEFDRVVERSERLAAQGLVVDPDEDEFLVQDPWRDEDFEEIVSEALDDLPDILRGALRNLAIVVTNGGIKADAYGMYEGDGIARDDFPDKVLIFRDSLRRDFGHDPDLLRDQITITVRHELAHHLGADELGVRDLGLE